MNYCDIYNKSITSSEEFWREQANQLEWYNLPSTILLYHDYAETIFFMLEL